MGTRIPIPDGVAPVHHVVNDLGSPKLRELRRTDSHVRFYNDSTLTPREREGMRVLAAVMAGCGPCNEMRAWRDKPGYSDQPIEEEFYENILVYRTWPGYTERERLSIEFCERYWLDHRSLAADDAFWATLKAHFTETELADLCILAGLMDGWLKTMDLFLGLDKECRIQGGTGPERHTVPA